MRVKITMKGLPSEYIDFLINEDLPAMQRVVKEEMERTFNAFKHDKNLRAGLLKKISSAIKKKIYPEHITEALAQFEKDMKGVEIIQWVIHSRTENSIVFEIIFDNRFFLLSEALEEIKSVKYLFGYMLLTRKKWLKRLEKTIKKEYSPEEYKIEVIEE